MDAAVVNGTWREFKENIQLRGRDKVKLGDFADSYIEDYCKPRNKKNTVTRKQTCIKPLKKFMGAYYYIYAPVL